MFLVSASDFYAKLSSDEINQPVFLQETPLKNGQQKDGQKSEIISFFLYCILYPFITDFTRSVCLDFLNYNQFLLQNSTESRKCI